jgi:hypothetical protein
MAEPISFIWPPQRETDAAERLHNAPAEHADAALDTPESIRAMRNFLLLTKFFGSIPPDVLNSLANTVVGGSRRENERAALDLIESTGKTL